MDFLSQSAFPGEDFEGFLDQRDAFLNLVHGILWWRGVSWARFQRLSTAASAGGAGSAISSQLPGGVSRAAPALAEFWPAFCDFLTHHRIEVRWRMKAELHEHITFRCHHEDPLVSQRYLMLDS